MANDPIGITPTLPRASSLFSCSRAQVARLLGFDGSPPPPKLQEAFDAGHEWEAKVAARLVEQGYVLTHPSGRLLMPGEEQESLLFEGVGTGHVDWIFDGEVIEDCKAMVKTGYLKLAREGFDSSPDYRWQGSFYYHALGLPFRLRVINKDSYDPETDTWDETLVPLEDPVPLDRIKRRVDLILACAAEGILPPCDRRDYPCPYRSVGDDVLGCNAPSSRKKKETEVAAQE